MTDIYIVYNEQKETEFATDDRWVLENALNKNPEWSYTLLEYVSTTANVDYAAWITKSCELLSEALKIADVRLNKDIQDFLDDVTPSQSLVSIIEDVYADAYLEGQSDSVNDSYCLRSRLAEYLTEKGYK